VDSTGSNFPFVRSPSLQVLSLWQLPQLHTGPNGPSPDWLSGLTGLTGLTISLAGETIDTIAFNNCSSIIRAINCILTTVLGSLAPIQRLSKLTWLSLDFTSISSTIPQNIAAVWPLLQSFSVSNCQLYGSLPSFANLPSLEQLYLGGNSLTGSLPEDLFQGSQGLTDVVLSRKYDLKHRNCKLFCPNAQHSLCYLVMRCDV
jgi:hypothetical protein